MRAIDYGIQHFGHYSYSNNKSNIYVFNEDIRLDDDSNEFKNETEEIDNNVYYKEIEFTNNEQTKFHYVLDGEILSEDTINYIKLSGITPYLEKNFEYNDEYDPNNEFNYLNTKTIEFENKVFLKLNKNQFPLDSINVFGQSKKKKDKPLFLLNQDLNKKNNSVIVFISDDGSKLERAYQNIECYQNEVILFLESDFGSNIFGSLLRVKTGNNVTDANQIPAKAIAKVVNAFKMNIDIDVATLTKAIQTQISSKSGLMHFVKQRFILTDRLISIPVNFTFDAVIGYMNTVSEGVEEHLKFKEHRWQYYNSDGTINPDANLLFFDPSVFDNLEEKAKRKEGKNIVKKALDEVDLFEAALFQKIEQSEQKTEFNEFNEYVTKALKKTSKILKTLKDYIRNPELLAIAITKNTLIALNAFLVGLLNSIFDVFKCIFDIISLLCQGLKAVREKGISLIANWSSYLGFFIETLENIIDTAINLFSIENLKAFFEFLIKTQKFLFELPVYLTKLAIDNETVVTADRIGYYTGYIIGMFIDVILGAIATGGIKTSADVFRVIAKQLQDLFRLGKKVLEKSFTFAGNVIESFVAVVTAIRKGAKNIKPFLDEVNKFIEELFFKVNVIKAEIAAWLVRQHKVSEATLDLLNELGVIIYRKIDENLHGVRVPVFAEGYLANYNDRTIFEGTEEALGNFVKKLDDIRQSGGNGKKKVKKYLDDFTDQFGKTLNVILDGKIVGKFTRGKEIEILDKNFKISFGGSKIILKENETIAITGLLDDVLKIKKMGRKMPGLWKNGVNIGGTDLLSSRVWEDLGVKYKHLLTENPKLFWKNRTDDFWELVNKPWLDEVIKRGDDVRFVTNPNLEKSKYVYLDDLDAFATGLDGKKVQTIFGREVEYLKQNGYKIENELAIKIKNGK